MKDHLIRENLASGTRYYGKIYQTGVVHGYLGVPYPPLIFKYGDLHPPVPMPSGIGVIIR
jgi:hypothetical protein